MRPSAAVMIAAQWKRIRDARMIEARVVAGDIQKRALVRVARRANHEFIKHIMETR